MSTTGLDTETTHSSDSHRQLIQLLIIPTSVVVAVLTHRDENQQLYLLLLISAWVVGFVWEKLAERFFGSKDAYDGYMTADLACWPAWTNAYRVKVLGAQVFWLGSACATGVFSYGLTASIASLF